MTPEELDEERANEARRRRGPGSPLVEDAIIAARLAREGWTPPPPVDPDLLAFREWAGSFTPTRHLTISDAYFAGARMARKQEREQAKVLLDELHRLAGGHKPSMNCAMSALAAYKAGKEAAR